MSLYFSTAYRWMRCARTLAPAPYRLVDDDLAAREGLAAHWVIERVLHDDATLDDMEGEMAFDVPIDHDMISHVAGYIEAMRPIIEAADSVDSECKLAFSEATGRADFFAREADRVTVADYKHGRRVVNAEGNWQLILAALAADMGEEHFDLIIYQPRARKARALDLWSITRAELLAYGQQIKDRISKLSRGFDDVLAGTHCQGCPHAASCRTLGYEIETRVAQMHDSDDLTWLRETQRMVKTRVGALETDIIARMNAGEYVPGWAFEQTYGNRKLTIDPITAEAILGVPTTKQVARTVAELERDGASAVILQAISDRVSTGTKLVPISSTTANNLFNNKG